MIRFIPLIFSICFLLFSCQNSKKDEIKKNKPNRQEELLRINKYLVDKDADIIKSYIHRRNWDMETTPTGLWYSIIQHGKGEAARSGKIARLNYKVWLLDGTLCYSSDSLGVKQFRIGKGGVEKGLEEGVLLLKVGDKARFIMPPHLAYGLIGDENKIPPRSTILYEVELIQISD
jgi:FKBP-type peptidyl-prolyl cis-trans isomerase